MRAFLKKNPLEVGHILNTYTTSYGQKRLEVRFAYSTIDAAVSEFELI